MIVANRAVQGRIRDIYPVIILSFNGQNGICCKKDSHNKRVRKHIIDKYAPRTNFYQFITVLLLITTGVVGKVLEEKMRVLNWALDAQKTMHGKIISVVLSVALIFSFSNFFYGDNAFAEEQKVETNTEVTTEPAQSEPVVTETEKKSEEPQSETPKQESAETSQTAKATTSEEQISTQAEGDTSDLSNNGNDETPEYSVDFDENSCTLAISGKVDVTNAMVQQYKGKVKIVDIDIDGNIGDGAFSYCGQLEEAIVKNAKTIGKTAFRYSNNLKKLSLSNVDVVGKSVAHGNKNLTELTLQNIGTIDEEAFQWCEGLTSIDLSGVKKLERSAFTFCNGLTEVTLANIELGTNPFYQCKNLASVTLDNATFAGVNTFDGCASLKNVTLKNMDTVGNNMFINCANLEKVSISSVKNIGATLFSGKANLKEVSITGENVTIGQSAFLQCSALSKVELKGVTAIDSYAFQYCKSLESIELDGVSTIRDCAFSRTGLKNATLTNIGTIGQYAFWDNGSLETVTMNDIDSIANYAFWNCSNLQTIDSLSNVKTSIGGFAFYGCSSLTGLTVADLTKMGYIGSNDEIMARVQAILAGKFNLDGAENINELGLEEGWAAGEVGKSSNWNAYDNGTQIMEQARWADENAGVAEVKVDAYYTGEKQMDYIFVADLSASMAQLGNAEDNNARFYDMQSKLMDMTGKLLSAPGYDCRVAIVSFGGEHNNNATQNSSGFLSQSEEVTSYIKRLAPLNENTDYGLGMQKALELAQGNANRNTVVVFLSDGAPNRNTSGDQDGTIAAQAIRDLKVPIYGVLHSPSASQASSAENKMKAVCDYVYKSTDTASFGQAMNSAFAAAYGDNTVTIPVNARDFNINNLNASAGTVEYNDGVITWTLSGMPFTQHTLTYNMNLTEENANRVGTYEYGLNNGNAHFGDTGASAGLSLSLSRTVADPANPDPTPTPTPDPTPAPEPDPAPNPGDGGATTPDDGGATIPDGGGATTPAAAPATPAAAPAAPAATPAAPAVVIPDEENPLAAPDQEIADDENPLAAFDHEECWVHWFMIAGIILTIIYGAAVVLRRTRNTKHIDKMEKDLIGTTDESTVTVGSAHHSHA